MVYKKGRKRRSYITRGNTMTCIPMATKDIGKDKEEENEDAIETLTNFEKQLVVRIKD